MIWSIFYRIFEYVDYLEKLKKRESEYTQKAIELTLVLQALPFFLGQKE